MVHDPLVWFTAPSSGERDNGLLRGFGSHRRRGLVRDSLVRVLPQGRRACTGTGLKCTLVAQVRAAADGRARACAGIYDASGRWCEVRRGVGVR